jgi:hypothetical protein
VFEWHFRERPDQIIEADLGPAWPGFTEALNDAVSTRAPRGQPAGISTYWIDRTLTALETANAPTKALASGNATSLALDGPFVVAQSDYEMWPDERMSREDFVEGMESWRAAALARLGGHS